MELPHTEERNKLRRQLKKSKRWHLINYTIVIIDVLLWHKPSRERFSWVSQDVNSVFLWQVYREACGQQVDWRSGSGDCDCGWKLRVFRIRLQLAMVIAVFATELKGTGCERNWKPANTLSQPTGDEETRQRVGGREAHLQADDERMRGEECVWGKGRGCCCCFSSQVYFIGQQYLQWVQQNQFKHCTL